jgi:hypothetical protein
LDLLLLLVVVLVVALDPVLPVPLCRNLGGDVGRGLTLPEPLPEPLPLQRLDGGNVDVAFDVAFDVHVLPEQVIGIVDDNDKLL